MEEMETGAVENTDVTEPSSEAPSESDSGGEAKAAAPKQEESIDWSKAFEHPRFKELVEQKNAALAAQKAMEQKLAQFESRFNQPQTPQAPSKEQMEFEALINDLKNIDPRLASVLEANSKAAKMAEELQKRLEGFEKTSQQKELQAQQQAAVAKINQLHESNKVSPEVKQLINDKLELLYMQGKLNLSEVEAAYKQTFEGHNKFVEALKRAERESYVAEKKKDSAVPASQPKGTTPKPGAKKPTWSKDPETARQQIVNKFLKQSAANRDADAV